VIFRKFAYIQFVVALAPCKSYFYFFNYLPCKNIGQVQVSWFAKPW